MERVFRISTIMIAITVLMATTCWAQNPKAVVSWGGLCPTRVKNMDFTGPAVYSLWVGAKNLTTGDANVGTDMALRLGPTIADAWRFDSPGCQGESVFVNVQYTANTKSCPVMKGTFPLKLTNLQYDPGTQTLEIRLVSSYDAFTPAPGVNYTLWNIYFNHAHSVAGVDGDPSTCDNADRQMTIAMEGQGDTYPPTVVLVGGGTESFTFADPSDQSVTWGAGCAQTAVEPIVRPARIALQPSYPNPSSRSSFGEFTLAEAGESRLAVFNAGGQLVKVLHDGWDEAGEHQFTWDGTDDAGHATRAGVYFIRLDLNNQTASERIVRIP